MSNYGNQYGQRRMTMLPPVIKWLLIINVVIFVLGMIPLYRDVSGQAITLAGYFRVHAALWPLGSNLFMPWQYLSYMFLHANFLHIFLNMLILWMFGLELEQLWGSKRFLTYYIIAGIGAGVIHTIVTMLMGTDNAPAVGASGAIMGVMLAFGLTFPDRVILVGFFFPMRAKYAILLFAAMDLFGGFQGTDNVAHFAHLGGALVGYILLKTGWHTMIANRIGSKSGSKPTNIGSQWQSSASSNPRPFSKARSGTNVIDVRYRDVTRPETPNKHITMDFGDDQEQIDLILDKISKQGYQSLTDEEKTLLVEASKKMR